ncbi:guanine deaminase [Kiloniella laminariae]|uniref:Guanine deaminase n=1 Tax=Kiloniella laminariae TaxID=454162 RepID=A0ABT4LIU1_9PROT|nr:guanine deaminase [Kiloniella laminariae]MCZ4280276.1 guanine deaminase [Kiloniella laminariae]
MTIADQQPSRVLRGSTVNFLANPRTNGNEKSTVYIKQGALVLGQAGRILWQGAFSDLPTVYTGLPCDDFGEQLILPGFIDAHIHFPQYRILAAPGKDLLDWLNRFTFPEESRYSSSEHAATAAEVFLDRLFTNGTTSALAFCSVHKACAEALFSAAEKRGMALLTGKTMMDRLAPDAVLDDPETGARESKELLDSWHNKGRLKYAITPRFAVTSTDAQLQLTGELYRDHPDCIMQTHLSESPGEIATVQSQFPWSKDYTDIYDHFGLLGPNSFFAHGIHLSERECARLAEAGSTVVHCPTSNNFLGSGLFDIDHVGNQARPVGVGVATDVGGGTSYSMLQTLGEAYKVAMLKGRKITAHDAFYMATLGNAERLKMESEIGSLDAGKWADIVVLDPKATPVLESRQEVSETLEDILFSLMILGDDRAIKATYVAGKSVYKKQ